MRVIICGGRDYPPFTGAEHAFLRYLHEQYPITEIISGGATGADEEGEIWAKSQGIDLTIMPANWVRDQKAAGPIRNRRMLRYLMADAADSCAVVAFPGGKGTANMLHIAELRGIPVFIYPPPAAYTP